MCDVAQAHDLEQAVLHFEPRRRWKTNRGAARSFDACMRLRAPFDTRPSAPSVTGRKRARGERQLRRLSSYEVHLIGFQTTSVGTARSAGDPRPVRTRGTVFRIRRWRRVQS